MRIAVVGASGLLGSALEGRLRRRGDHVVTITRRPLDDAPGRTPVAWDGATPLASHAIEGCDAVVNLAGAPVAQRWTDAAKREIVTSRVDLTARLVEAIGDRGPRTLVQAGAVGYYGPGEHPVDEDAPAGAGFLAELSARWEDAAMGAAAMGARVVVLRSGIVLSTRGGALERMLGPARLGLGGPIGNGRQWFPWIHIDDELGLIVRAIDDTAARGPLNCVAPGIVRQRDFAHALGRALNRPAVAPVPRMALRAMFGEGADAVLEGQHVVPREAERIGYEFAFPEIDGALADLIARGV